MRNSDPDREALESWFDKAAMLPIEDIERVMDGAIAMGCNQEVCLSHFNEPLADPRIVDIAKMARAKGFKRVFFCSNADYLTEELAEALDGVVDDIGFSFYMKDPVRSERKAWCKSLFKKTFAKVGDGDHMLTHYSPLSENLIQISNRASSKPCNLPKLRFIVNHKGQMNLCCDDLIGRYDLGTIYDGKTIEEMWYSDVHQKYVIALQKPGGRSIHPHCVACPRVQ